MGARHFLRALYAAWRQNLLAILTVMLRQTGSISAILIAATNSSGGVMVKMISPPNIATGASVTALKGREGLILARTFKHSIVLTLLLGCWSKPTGA